MQEKWRFKKKIFFFFSNYYQDIFSKNYLCLPDFLGFFEWSVSHTSVCQMATSLTRENKWLWEARRTCALFSMVQTGFGVCQ